MPDERLCFCVVWLIDISDAMQHALVGSETGGIQNGIAKVCPHQHVCCIESKMPEGTQLRYIVQPLHCVNIICSVTFSCSSVV